MNIGNIFLITFLTYFSLKLINIFKSGVKNSQQTHAQLDNLRLKKVKTLEEQKEFINLMYPKRQKVKWKFNNYLNMFCMIIITIGIFKLFWYIFDVFNFAFSITYSILLICIIPIIVSFFLNKFGINDNNVLYNMFKKVKK